MYRQKASQTHGKIQHRSVCLSQTPRVLCIYLSMSVCLCLSVSVCLSLSLYASLQIQDFESCSETLLQKCPKRAVSLTFLPRLGMGTFDGRKCLSVLVCLSLSARLSLYVCLRLSVSVCLFTGEGQTPWVFFARAGFASMAARRFHVGDAPRQCRGITKRGVQCSFSTSSTFQDKDGYDVAAPLRHGCEFCRVHLPILALEMPEVTDVVFFFLDFETQDWTSSRITSWSSDSCVLAVNVSPRFVVRRL